MILTPAGLVTFWHTIQVQQWHDVLGGDVESSPSALRDLLDVCEAQDQFAPNAAVPSFGGQKGPDTSTSTREIQVGNGSQTCGRQWPSAMMA